MKWNENWTKGQRVCLPFTLLCWREMITKLNPPNGPHRIASSFLLLSSCYSVLHHQGSLKLRESYPVFTLKEYSTNSSQISTPHPIYKKKIQKYAKGEDYTFPPLFSPSFFVLDKKIKHSNKTNFSYTKRKLKKWQNKEKGETLWWTWLTFVVN